MIASCWRISASVRRGARKSIKVTIDTKRSLALAIRYNPTCLEPRRDDKRFKGKRHIKLDQNEELHDVSDSFSQYVDCGDLSACECSTLWSDISRRASIDNRRVCRWRIR